MATVDTVADSGAAACSVLTNPQLFRAIVSWQSGWPGIVALHWREIKATHSNPWEAARTFVWELIRHSDVRALEAAMRIAGGPFWINTISPAIAAGDADAMRLAERLFPLYTGSNLRREYWVLAVREFPGHVDVLEALRELHPLLDIDQCLWARGYHDGSPMVYDAPRRIEMREHFHRQWVHSVENIESPVLAEWLITKISRLCISTSLIHTAALRGNLALVRYLSTVESQEITPSTFLSLRHLIRQDSENHRPGFLAVLDFLLRHHTEIDSCELEQACIDDGDLETLALVHCRRGLRGLDGVDLHQAAVQGHLDVLQMVADKTSASCSSAAIDRAAANNHSHIFENLDRLQGVTCTTAAMDGAAGNGHLHMVQFFHENRSEGCTTRAMDGAATGGFLDVVMFLHEHQQEGCTTGAMDGAARNGHLHIVQFLHESRYEGCSPAGFPYPSLFTRRNFPKLAQRMRSTLLYMLEHREEMHAESIEREALRARDLEVLTIIQRTRGLQFLHGIHIDDIAGEGNLPLIQFLVEFSSVVCSTMAMDFAAAHNHLDVVQYLHETRTEGCTTMAMDMAANANNWDVVAFLDEHRHEGCSGALLVAAVRLGRLDLVKRYVVRVTPEQCGAALVVAGVYGHAEIQVFLRNQLEL